MKLKFRKFMKMVKSECGNFFLFAFEIGENAYALFKKVLECEPLDYATSEKIVNLFGAEKMMSVIDWEGINVRCPN